MIVIGLTGGIGSGKTTVAKIFQEKGIPVFFADDEAKKLMQDSEVLRAKIRATFGDKSYLNNTLNRAYLAQIVFSDKSQLDRLNALVHPAVKNHFIEWQSKQKSKYVIYENAILFESKSNLNCDFIIVVSADKETRIKRVIKRDNISRQEVLKRIDNQWTQARKMALADAVIINDNSQDLYPQILSIQQDIKKKFKLN